MSLSITEMNVTDFITISPILQSEFDSFWSPNLLKSEMEKDDTLCLVAKQNEVIVGFICIWFSIDDIHIMNLVTRIPYRGQGIASHLLEEMMHRVGKKPITLEVRNSNATAIHLYEKYGFKTLGVRKHYYTYNNHTEDAIIMTRDPA